MSDIWENIGVGMKIETHNFDCDLPNSVYWIATVMKIAGEFLFFIRQRCFAYFPMLLGPCSIGFSFSACCLGHSNLVFFNRISSKFHVLIASIKLSFKFKYGLCPTKDNKDFRQNGHRLSVSAALLIFPCY